jgi:RsiW-degrading membrane proteinase PrsW (M82 family)
LQGLVYLLSIVCLSSLPIWITYLYIKRINPQLNSWLFLVALGAGALSMLLGSILQVFMPVLSSGSPISLLYTIFLRNAFSEEAGRFAVFWILLYIASKTIAGSRTYSRETVIYVGVLAGFSFAMLETLSYGLLDIQLVLIRTLTSAPLHAACASRIGLAVFLFAENRPENNTSHRVSRALFYGISAVLIHGIYNLLLLFPSTLAVLPIILAYVALGSALTLAKMDRP